MKKPARWNDAYGKLLGDFREVTRQRDESRKVALVLAALLPDESLPDEILTLIASWGHENGQ